MTVVAMTCMICPVERRKDCGALTVPSAIGGHVAVEMAQDLLRSHVEWAHPDVEDTSIERIEIEDGVALTIVAVPMLSVPASEGGTWPKLCPQCGAPWEAKSRTMGRAFGQPHHGVCSNGHHWYEPYPRTVDEMADLAQTDEVEETIVGKACRLLREAAAALDALPPILNESGSVPFTLFDSARITGPRLRQKADAIEGKVADLSVVFEAAMEKVRPFLDQIEEIRRDRAVYGEGDGR